MSGLDFKQIEACFDFQNNDEDFPNVFVLCPQCNLLSDAVEIQLYGHCKYCETIITEGC